MTGPTCDSPPVPDVLVTMPFTDAQLDRLRAVSPSLRVTRADADTADYSRVEVLYAGAPPRDLSRAPALKWVQLHMAGVNALRDHPLFASSAITLTTTSGVHAATIAEYALTMLLALAHRVLFVGVAALWNPDLHAVRRLRAQRRGSANENGHE